jgi:hypothetical protein
MVLPVTLEILPEGNGISVRNNTVKTVNSVQVIVREHQNRHFTRDLPYNLHLPLGPGGTQTYGIEWDLRKDHGRTHAFHQADIAFKDGTTLRISDMEFEWEAASERAAIRKALAAKTAAAVKAKRGGIMKRSLRWCGFIP